MFELGVVAVIGAFIAKNIQLIRSVNVRKRRENQAFSQGKHKG